MMRFYSAEVALALDFLHLRGTYELTMFAKRSHMNMRQV
jgi:hypothetical protein